MNFIPSLILILILNTAAPFIQNRQVKSSMTKDEVLQMATLLMALKEEYGMLDQDPDSDFLIFTRDDEELEFFPKRELPKQMEALGLILNKGDREPVREPSISYELDDKTDSWKAITTEGWIICQYQITAKGQQFLRDAPTLLGHAVPRLKLATEKSVEAHTRLKTLKVVTYDREARQKMRDEFIRTALKQVEALFAPADTDRPENELPEGFFCGPSLWAKIETEAIKNGVHPGTLTLKVMYSSWPDNKSGSNTYDRPEKGITSRAQVGLFRKTLFQVFPATGSPSIKALNESESAQYQDLQDMAFGMSPFLVSSAAFFVEYDNVRFLVKVRNQYTDDFINISPKVSLVELVERR